MKALCKCGHDDHSDITPHVCWSTSCRCVEFVAAPTPSELKTAQDKAQADLKHYITQYKTVTERLRYVLAHNPELRNFSTQEFITWYHDNVDPDAYFETVRRSKQKLVQESPKQYGPTNTETIRQQHIKQQATKQWVQQ